MSSIPAFANHLPVKVRFGEGVAASLPAVLREAGASRVLVMTDAGIEGFNPEARSVLEALRADGGLVVSVHTKPAGEPGIEDVDAAVAALRAADAQAVVALGGGSVIDTAKAARLCAQLGVSFREFLAGDRVFPEPVVTLVALPTSAGTGSEVSGGAVVSDLQAGTKSGIAHGTLRPHYALVDPRLTWSMPPHVTAHTGIDALAQAIAGMVARCRTPIGDAIALEAIRMIGRSLVAATRDGTDAAARADMACGSMMAGLTMNIADCTAEHSLGQAIGGVTHVPHGLTVGLVLVETLERERAHVPGQLERVADALGAPPLAPGAPADGSRAVEAVRGILRDLDFPVLRDIGVTAEDLDHLTDLALADFFITQAPAPWSRQEVRAAFDAAYALTAR